MFYYYYLKPNFLQIHSLTTMPMSENKLWMEGAGHCCAIPDPVVQGSLILAALPEDIHLWSRHGLRHCLNIPFCVLTERGIRKQVKIRLEIHHPTQIKTSELQSLKRKGKKAKWKHTKHRNAGNCLGLH